MDFFNQAYRGSPPWDIGRPQKEFVELVMRGEITGSVLDIGCGTGEHALFFASEGHEVWGIDTATDSGLFHTLSDEYRPVFVENLAAVLVPGGHYFMLCFSDLEPPGYGPRRISLGDIRENFRDGWTINYIREARFESRTREEGPKAWLSSITRE
jgi:cyclopropane fatty-acyl-phospholipid synthase-like methyltransferase